MVPAADSQSHCPPAPFEFLLCDRRDLFSSFSSGISFSVSRLAANQCRCLVSAFRRRAAVAARKMRPHVRPIRCTIRALQIGLLVAFAAMHQSAQPVVWLTFFRYYDVILLAFLPLPLFCCIFRLFSFRLQISFPLRVQRIRPSQNRPCENCLCLLVAEGGTGVYEVYRTGSYKPLTSPARLRLGNKKTGQSSLALGLFSSPCA